MYELVEHTGELAIKVTGRDLPALFVSAAEAMNQYLSEGIQSERNESTEEIKVSAQDKESLLVAWLSEILYRIEVNKKIYLKFNIKNLDDHSLSAEMIGYPIKNLARYIKAVTHHNLAIEKTNAGYQVIITFDV